MSENKVWVVLEGYNYEGYSKPEGVFSSKELAEAVAAKRRADKCQPDYVDVFEYEVDVELDLSPELPDEPSAVMRFYEGVKPPSSEQPNPSSTAPEDSQKPSQ